MRVSDYQRAGVDIKTLPIFRLRSIDIQTVDEEKEIARLIAEKSKGIIPQQRVNIDDIKSRMDKELTQRTLTKEKEVAYQKEVDERVDKVMPTQSEPTQTEPTPRPISEPVKEIQDKPEEVLAVKIKKLKKK